MTLPELSIRYRTVVFVLVFFGVLWGWYSFKTTPRREDTEFTIRVCTVITTWNGASAKQVEDLVTYPLEKAIEELDEVKKTQSTTTPGQSIIKVELEDSVNDVDQVWDKLRARVRSVDLADGAGTPYVNSNYGDTTALVFALYQVPLPGEKKIRHKYNMRELEKVCENIRDELKLLPGVAMVVIYSSQDEQIYLEIDAGNLSRQKITTDGLRTRLNAKNAIASGGVIESKSSRFHLVTVGDFNALDQINRMVGGNSKSGVPVLLRDVNMRARKGFDDPPDVLTRYTDNQHFMRPCIVVYYTMKDNQNIVDIGNQVKARIPLWEKSIIPPDMKLSIVGDQPRTVTENISIFTSNLIQSIIILTLVAFLFIGPRVALIMGTAIPVIVAISFALVRLVDVKLEKMCITALVISLGMLVDCAIEICDNVHRLQEEGYSRFDAVIEGARQVTWPILIGTLTTVFAFAPMVLIPGNSGEYIRSIPVVVSVTLLVSWVVALSFTVTLTWLILKPGTDKVPPLMRIVHFISGGKSESTKELESRPYYRRALYWCVRHPYTVLTMSLGAFVFIVVLALTGHIDTDFIPSGGGKKFVTSIWLPEGSSIKRTSKVCAEVEKIILANAKYTDSHGNQQNRLENMISFIGEGAPRIKLSYMIEFPKSNYAEILVNTTSTEVVENYIRAVQREGETMIPGARISVKKLGLGPPVRYPVEIRILGKDYNILKKFAGRVENELRKIKGTYNIHDSWGNLGYQLNIEPDEEKCIAAGVTRKSIAQSLNALFSGHYLTTYREGDHQIPVYLRLPPGQRQSIPDLDSIYVEGKYGKIPLASVADIKLSRDPTRVERYNKRRNMQVECQLRDGYLANPTINKIAPKLKEIRRDLPEGYEISIGGTKEKSEESIGYVAHAMLVSLFLIIICLIIYFNAILKTVIVLLTLPLALVGAFLGLWIMDQPLGFFAQLGLLALFGIVVNGAIVLFDFIGMLIRERRRNVDLKAKPEEKSFHGLNHPAFLDCVVDGSVLRVRPILMTTCTTIGGLLPLMFNGGPLFVPLATVLIFGLALSTALTLFVVPTAYVLFAEKFKMKLINEFNEHLES